MDDQISLLRQIAMSSAESAKWTREAALPAVRDRVARALDSDQKRRVYDAIRKGNLSYRAIEAETGVNRATVRTWVTEWEAQRLVEPETQQPLALFTLRELGIPTPPPKTTRAQGKNSPKGGSEE